MRQLVRHHFLVFTLEKSAGATLTYEILRAGLAFSPDRRRMYFAMQKAGVLYEVIREDGHAFDGMHLDIKYHAAAHTHQSQVKRWVHQYFT
jgi:sugar lactone lactonase YvrE